MLISIPFLNFIFSYLLIVIHELGHAFTAWIFGYPAIPAFDFIFGGGVTSIGDRVGGLVVFIYCCIAFLLYSVRFNPFALKFLGGLSLLYSVFSFFPIHRSLRTFMGHGFELIFAGIFLYRGISGFACQHSGERSLYAMLSFFTVFNNFYLSGSLIFSESARVIYEQGKGGIIDSDFVVLANQFQVSVSSIAAFFILCCLITPAIAFLLYFYRNWWGDILLRITSNVN
ncbi:hypothetical protein [Lusitaniella coriacea]|uniref:hypothetical protein n=1 Tax=Lusitaniella coriacea TaxID=1983105 RepID=UPI003CF5A348